MVSRFSHWDSGFVGEDISGWFLLGILQLFFLRQLLNLIWITGFCEIFIDFLAFNDISDLWRNSFLGSKPQSGPAVTVPGSRGELISCFMLLYSKETDAGDCSLGRIVRDDFSDDSDNDWVENVENVENVKGSKESYRKPVVEHHGFHSSDGCTAGHSNAFFFDWNPWNMLLDFEFNFATLKGWNLFKIPKGYSNALHIESRAAINQEKVQEQRVWKHLPWPSQNILSEPEPALYTCDGQIHHFSVTTLANMFVSFHILRRPKMFVGSRSDLIDIDRPYPYVPEYVPELWIYECARQYSRWNDEHSKTRLFLLWVELNSALGDLDSIW